MVKGFNYLVEKNSDNNELNLSEDSDYLPIECSDNTRSETLAETISQTIGVENSELISWFQKPRRYKVEFKAYKSW